MVDMNWTVIIITALGIINVLVFLQIFWFFVKDKADAVAFTVIALLIELLFVMIFSTLFSNFGLNTTIGIVGVSFGLPALWFGVAKAVAKIPSAVAQWWLKEKIKADQIADSPRYTYTSIDAVFEEYE